MDVFWKAAAAALVTATLGIVLAKQQKDLFPLLIISGCLLVAVAGMKFLRPVLAFLSELERLGNLRSDYLGILIKALGIGLVTELAGSVCADSGSGSLAKALGILGTCVIIWLSIPVFQAVLDLIVGILGGI